MTPKEVTPMQAIIESPTPAQIMQARLVLGLSQTEFGRLLGRSLRQIQRLEYGESTSPPELALALLAILREVDLTGGLQAALDARSPAEL
jgi:DNA-binding transcriptional regulator YiaG